MWVIDGELMRPLLDQPGGVPLPLPPVPGRCPQVYVQNSSLEIAWGAWPSRARQHRRRAGRRRSSPKGVEGFSIDYPDDWRRAEELLAQRRGGAARGRGAEPMSPCATSRPRSWRGFADRRRPGRPGRGVRRRLPHQHPVHDRSRGLGAHRHQLQLHGRRARWLHLRAGGADDRYFSSKGHDAPGLYAVLIGARPAGPELLHRLRRLRRPAGPPGRPDDARGRHQHRLAGDGDLEGEGHRRWPTACAAAAARVFVLTGDGELQEGQFWESLGSARQPGLGGITVDRRPQQDPVRHLGRATSATSATWRRSSRRSAGTSRAATVTTSRRSRRALARARARSPNGPR